ncbi:hypothetical protein C0995_002535, partial [Termitomyces sp. Mi166
AIEERSFDIKESDVSALHQILFGEQAAENDESHNGEEKLNKRIDEVDVIELMLASVGVSFRAAREAEEDDRSNMVEMTWEGLEGIQSQRWLGRNIRCVCGIQPIEGDDTYSEDERDEEEDEDEDEDDDSEWKDGPRRGAV